MLLSNYILDTLGAKFRRVVIPEIVPTAPATSNRRELKIENKRIIKLDKSTDERPEPAKQSSIDILDRVSRKRNFSESENKEDLKPVIMK